MKRAMARHILVKSKNEAESIKAKLNQNEILQGHECKVDFFTVLRMLKPSDRSCGLPT